MADEDGKTNGTMSLEERFEQLEKKFAELEAKFDVVKGLVEREDSERSKEEYKDESKVEATPPIVIPDGRLRIVTNKYDREKGERRDHESNEDISDATTRTEKYAALLRRYINEDELADGDMEIYDLDLIDFLGRIFAHYPDHYFTSDRQILRSPYPVLIRHWDVLMAESEKTGQGDKDQQIRNDLKDVLQALLSGSGDLKLDEYFLARDGFKKQNTITFDTLWTIFSPGQVVYGSIFFKQPQLFIVEDSTRTWPREEGSRRSGTPYYWTLRVWTYDFTGKVFERRALTLPIESFDGAKPITGLPFYPFEAATVALQTEVKKTLLERGKKFRHFCTLDEDDRMYNYHGDAIVEKQGFRSVQVDDMSDDDSDAGFRSRRGGDIYIPASKIQSVFPINKSNVMVDFESYYRYGSDVSQIGDIAVSENIDECRCPDCEKNEALRNRFKPYYDGMKGGADETWEDLQTMMCPPRVLGYVLKDKRWAQFALDNLSEIPNESYEEVMKRLHLSGENGGAEIKELLFGLVKHHGGEAKRDNTGYMIDDIVSDKGKGIVFLLYGDPGVGKTSTAQMIARAARKPLFSIGVADVGTKAKQVESNLETIFDLATKWKAILLIDEADVFLQSRSQGQIRPSAEGSALVSVFLRVLEYYRGILFLTTNQIAQFDVAVQSRVHIALKYKQLDEGQTREIFMGFVNQYNTHRLVEGYDSFSKYAHRELYKKHFDGRQIRNIVTSAMGYARGLGMEKMNMDHIRHVVGFVEDFKLDLAGQMMKWHEQQKGTGL